MEHFSDLIMQVGACKRVPLHQQINPEKLPVGPITLLAGYEGGYEGEAYVLYFAACLSLLSEPNCSAGW